MTMLRHDLLKWSNPYYGYGYGYVIATLCYGFMT